MNPYFPVDSKHSKSVPWYRRYRVVSWRPNSTSDWRLKRYQLIKLLWLASDSRFSSLKSDYREPHGESTDNGQVIGNQQLTCRGLLRATDRRDARGLAWGRPTAFTTCEAKQYQGANARLPIRGFMAPLANKWEVISKPMREPRLGSFPLRDSRSITKPSGRSLAMVTSPSIELATVCRRNTWAARSGFGMTVG